MMSPPSNDGRKHLVLPCALFREAYENNSPFFLPPLDDPALAFATNGMQLDYLKTW